MTVVTGGCELLCGCLELNPDPLKEQQVCLHSETSPQFLNNFEGKNDEIQEAGHTCALVRAHGKVELDLEK